MKLPALFLAMTVAVVTSVSAAAKTVVEVLDEAPNYKIFSSGMHAAGLAEEFMGEGPFTIFAPTDEAFAKLPPDMWPTLLKPENKAKLVSFVTHHIVPSKVVTEGLKDGPITTLNGRDITVSRDPNGKIKAGNALATAPSLMASNGVVHGVDAVITQDKN